jgi:hypothetical protein
MKRAEIKQEARKLDPPLFALFARDKCGDNVRIIVRQLGRTRNGRGSVKREKAGRIRAEVDSEVSTRKDEDIWGIGRSSHSRVIIEISTFG